VKCFPPSPRPVNIRKIVELPWQNLQIKLWDKIEEMLTDIFFLESNTEAGFAFQLFMWYNKTLQILPKDRQIYGILILLREALGQDIYFIKDYPTTLFQCLWNSCWWFDCKDAILYYELLSDDIEEKIEPFKKYEPEISKLLERWRNQKENQQSKFPWLRSLRPPAFALGRHQIFSISGSKIVNCVGFSPNNGRIVSGSSNGFVNVWDASNGKLIITFHTQNDDVNSVSFSPDGKQIASGSEDGVICFFNVTDLSFKRSINANSGSVKSLAYSPNNKLIAFGSKDNSIRIWDLEFYEEKLCIKGHSGIVEHVTFSPDGKYLLSASLDETIKLWTVETGVEIFSFANSDKLMVKYKESFLQNVERDINSDKRSLGDDLIKELYKSMGDKGDVKGQNILENTTIKLNAYLDKNYMWFTSVAYSNNGLYFAAGSRENIIRVWNAHSKEEILCLKAHLAPVNSVTFSPDSKKIASCSDDATILIWDLISGKCVASFSGHFGVISCLAFSSDGKQLVSSGHDCTIRLWNIEDFDKYRKILIGHSHISEYQSFEHRSKHVFYESIDYVNRSHLASMILNPIKEYNFVLIELSLLEVYDKGISQMLFSPCGRFVASKGDDLTVRIWDINSGQQVSVLLGHIGAIWSMTFSPDSIWFATGSYDRTVRLWDVRSGNEIMIFKGHNSSVCSVAFSPDGNLLLSASFDRTIRIWDWKNKLEKACLIGHDGPVKCINFSPNLDKPEPNRKNA